MQNKPTNHLLRFLKASGIFLIGNVLSKTISFFMLPLYTAYIPPAGYGQYDVTITYVSLVSSFLFFDLWSGIIRFTYDEKELSGKRTVIRSGLTIYGFSALVYCLISVSVALFAEVPYMLHITLFGLGTSLTTLYGYAARGLGKNIEFAISGVLGTVVIVLTNILLLTVWDFDYSSLYIAQIVGALAQIIYLEYHTSVLGCLLSVKFDKQLALSIFRYSIPLCLNVTAYWLLKGFNRIFINGIMGADANGIYAVGAKFGVIISLVTGCFAFAWQDISFSHSAEHGNDGVFFSKACDAYTKFIGTGAVLLIPACFIIFPMMVDASYGAAKDTIPLFLLVSLASAISSFVGNMFYAIKKTNMVFVSMLISCIVNFALCFPLIRWLGLNGANLSALIGLLLNIVIRYLILKKNIPFHMDMRNIVIIATWVLMSMAVYQWGNLLVNIGWLTVSTALALFWFKDMLKTLISSLKG